MPVLTFTTVNETPFFLSDDIFLEKDAHKRTQMLFEARAACKPPRFGNARPDYDWREAARPDWWAFVDFWGAEELPRDFLGETHSLWEGVSFLPDGTARVTTPWLNDVEHGDIDKLRAQQIQFVLQKDNLLNFDLLPIMHEIKQLLKAWAVTAVQIAEKTYNFARGKVYNAGQPRRKRGYPRNEVSLMFVVR